MKKVNFLLFLFIITLPLFAQNHMDLLSEISGEQPYSQFGYKIATLDFNADGYDDLVVEANRWKFDPDTLYTGKMYFYFGKEHCFGDSADMTVSGYRTPDSSYSFMRIASIGDVNGDGYDDVGYYSFKNNNLRHINFLFGNSVKDSIPDRIFQLNTLDFFPSYLRKLGDINGDGYDDVGFMLESYPVPERKYCYIIYGGEDESTLSLFKILHYPDPDNQYNAIKFRGIGDVNNDGYDDIQITYSIQIRTFYQHDMVFFGGAEMDTIPDFEFTNNEIQGTDGHGLRLGDFNGDGRDDFILDYEPSNGGIYVYTSNENHEIEYLLTLYSGMGYLQYIGSSYGDVNGDGKSDIVIGNEHYPYGFGDGRASLILGGDNGESDYIFHSEMEFDQYSHSVRLGDFNGDGCDEVAIGAPCLFTDSWEGINGEVWVYLGSPNLHDTVQNSNDEINGINNITIKAFPNPFNPSTTISFFTNKADKVNLSIYNIKGQKIITLVDKYKEKGNHSVIWNGIDEHNKKVSSGVYFYKFDVNGKTKGIKKCLMLK